MFFIPKSLKTDKYKQIAKVFDEGKGKIEKSMRIEKIIRQLRNIKIFTKS